MTISKRLARQTLEALEIGYQYAHDCAERFHIEMAGYKQKRHETIDAEVRQIADSIAALRQALEHPKQEQKPVAYSYTSRVTGTQTFSLHPKPPHLDSHSWDIKPLYTEPLAVKVNTEMIEALRAFLRAPSVGSSGYGSSTIVVQDFHLRAARAAIAKAEGTV